MRNPIAVSPSLFLALAGLLCPCAAPLRAQGGGQCPDQGATHVPGAGQDLAPWRTCYLQVHLLGVVVSLAWARCPSGHVYVPDHDECLGAYAFHTRCEDQGYVPIQLELCRCVTHAGGWYSPSTCECQTTGVMGFLVPGHSVECP